MTSFGVESWIWYSFAVCMVLMRMTARLLHFKSFLRLQLEDFLMIFLTCLYTILIVFLNIDLNVSTNLIDPAHPVVLTPHEISVRTWGSKTVLLVEQCMCAVQWATKACLLLLYWRLTQNLKQGLIVKCAAVYVATTYIVMEVLYFAVWCRPFYEYWKTPTDNAQCNTALHHLITNLFFNLTSDVLILSIPLPLFLRAHLEFKRKLLLVFPFSLGLFTMLCAILSKVSSFKHPYSSEWVYWYCREASTAMIVTNMPYSWGLLRKIFHVRSFLGGSDSTDQMQDGRPKELQGYSAGGVPLASQTRSRQVSHATALSSWRHPGSSKKHEASTKPDSGTNTWEGGIATDKAIKAEAMAGSSSDSSGDTIRRPAQAATTDWTLDRLYPLDDDKELERMDVAQRRYDG
ncbi:hypothetical protein LTR10_019372 [Elasticomyces elasticus]|uniref:Rhodopsin domain-containing protein n=1 Tax=Exophiala sideris TaxID=1016849 RepID=A0ABR0IVB3_9EURO|nr:hypothetical protein LTR10_019372 [Elasticomyces elasticus]KAK5021413.1 hypothetical protein LTS07_011023 [Exophiala sideris]KAK5025411.1 hypothetical protein LTR13_010488 [Exophiala sideris]KAK5049262.1 hypothetical protein LTR69_011047 [Exophiala sideris]KAK5176935.1 hypothetical protein LTR44_010508 [Eurotiomycetes sp. CCFEE 6388]